MMSRSSSCVYWTFLVVVFIIKSTGKWLSKLVHHPLVFWRLPGSMSCYVNRRAKLRDWLWNLESARPNNLYYTHSYHKAPRDRQELKAEKFEYLRCNEHTRGTHKLQLRSGHPDQAQEPVDVWNSQEQGFPLQLVLLTDLTGRDSSWHEVYISKVL